MNEFWIAVDRMFVCGDYDGTGWDGIKYVDQASARKAGDLIYGEDRAYTIRITEE